MFDSITHEVLLFRKTVGRDLTASMLPALLFSFSSTANLGSWAFGLFAETVLVNVLYFTLYIYCFCLANQIVGRSEDRENKPDRPIPSGLLTIEGAWFRWIMSMILFPVLGWGLRGEVLLKWAIAWQVLLVAYNFFGLDKHWLLKNLVFITLGTMTQMGAAWEIVQPLAEDSWRIILTVSVLFGVTLNLQDLRDVGGDKKAGRKTLPIVIGVLSTRWVLCVAVLFIPAVMRLSLQPNIEILMTLSVEVLLAFLNIVVAHRVVRLRTKESDHRTYMIHTYWFCAVMASAFIFLSSPQVSSGQLGLSDSKLKPQQFLQWSPSYSMQLRPHDHVSNGEISDRPPLSCL